MPSQNYRAYIGCYPDASKSVSGGIYVADVDSNGTLSHVRLVAAEPREAGYLCHASLHGTLYAVDERKTDGRGPVNPPSSVFAYRIDAATGGLEFLNSVPAPGPRPTYLSLGKGQDMLFTANHGDFQHVEQVVRNAAGEWVSKFVYDDSTSIAYNLGVGGEIASIRDIVVLQGHGLDPNRSPQAGGHAQACSHAHCAVVDPSGRYLVICNKGTDQVLVYAIGERLSFHSCIELGMQTAPRHLEFSANGHVAFMTCELSSEVVSLDFSFESRSISILDRKRTVTTTFTSLNEPAEIRLHPSERFVYVNNRGEDSLTWFSISSDFSLTWQGSIQLAQSIHPGLAARSFQFTSGGELLLVADRPADKVLSYAVNVEDGMLTLVDEISLSQPAYVQIVPV